MIIKVKSVRAIKLIKYKDNLSVMNNSLNFILILLNT